MEWAKVILYLVVGGSVLSWGANLFVNAASHLSRRLGISPLIIGLTVVAFGTSAPELAVNILAAFKGNADLAMGNVVGSNVFNIAFIIGLCALIKPLVVSTQLIKIDIPIMVFISLLMWWMSQDLLITNTEGGLLFFGLIIYLSAQFKLSKNSKAQSLEFEQEFSATGTPLKDGLRLLLGLGLLIGGAQFFVDGAIQGARLLGWPEAVIGLTIIAAGTSLPEVATSVAATLKGERDIAIGNVVGSNIFNILGVIGVTAIVTPFHLKVDNHMAHVDIVVMTAVTLVCVPFCLWKRQLGRFLGITLFSSWIGYTYYLISRAAAH